MKRRPKRAPRRRRSGWPMLLLPMISTSPELPGKRRNRLQDKLEREKKKKLEEAQQADRESEADSESDESKEDEDKKE